MADPIVITSIQDLENINNNLSGNYVLGANIDASGFNFIPIGSASNPFTGILDGQGYTISNLMINSTSTDSGLFGYVGATGTVRNVGVTNVSVTSTSSYVGGLVGENFGTLSESYATGNVSGVGFVGALVGGNGSSGSITQSFATGTANGQNDIGGLVGINQGAITQSYATGTTNPSYSAGVAIGGLVGVNGSTGTITQSYATGLVGAGGGFALGGLVGSGTGTVTASYWDTETTGRSTSTGGTGLTTAQLESGTLPNGFDPSVWFDTTGQFPELLWQVNAPEFKLPFGPSATATITQSYGERDHGGAGSNQFDQYLYYSVDFKLNFGTPVLAEGSGTVVNVSDTAQDTKNGAPTYTVINGVLTPTKLATTEHLGPHSLGNYVTILYDNGVYATYAHLEYITPNKLPVHIGDQVNLGETIGYVGDTGAFTGTHLHVTYGVSDINLGTAKKPDLIADGSHADNPDPPVAFPALADKVPVDGQSVTGDNTSALLANYMATFMSAHNAADSLTVHPHETFSPQDFLVHPHS